MTRESLMTAFTGIAVACAAIVAGTIVRREFFQPAPSSTARRIAEPQRVENWQNYLTAGHRIGPDGAPVTILEFADFECPACEQFFRRALGPIKRLYPEQIAVVFRHWPLPYHRFAYPAARASECAASQGKFGEFHDLLYQHQDSLGLKSFTAFARDAGVPDLQAFDRCNGNLLSVAAIEEDTRAAKAAGGGGTPTVIIDGLRLAAVPDSSALDSIVRAILARKSQH